MRTLSLVFSLWLLASAPPVFAQQFAGAHKVTLTSAGVDGATLLESHQMVTEYHAGDRTLSIRMKTQGLTFTASAEALQVLREVFQVDAFPLWEMEADLSAARPHPEGKGIIAPVTIRYHGQTSQPREGYILLRETTDAAHLDLRVVFSLSDLGLAEPASRSRRISSMWELSVENARLMRR